MQRGANLRDTIAQGGQAMKLSRRQSLHLATTAAALPVLSRIAQAQAYPTRPVRIIVGFAPGGGTDVLARIFGQWLSERLGRPFLIENRAGAGGNIATEAAVNARPDGYTLLMAGPNDGEDYCRVHRLCQGQSGQDQHGIRRHREPGTGSWARSSWCSRAPCRRRRSP